MSFGLEQSLLIARIGTISSHDAQAIKQIWASQSSLTSDSFTAEVRKARGGNETRSQLDIRCDQRPVLRSCGGKDNPN